MLTNGTSVTKILNKWFVFFFYDINERFMFGRAGLRCQHLFSIFRCHIIVLTAIDVK